MFSTKVAKCGPFTVSLYCNRYCTIMQYSMSILVSCWTEELSQKHFIVIRRELWPEHFQNTKYSYFPFLWNIDNSRQHASNCAQKGKSLIRCNFWFTNFSHFHSGCGKDVPIIFLFSNIFKVFTQNIVPWRVLPIN